MYFALISTVCNQHRFLYVYTEQLCVHVAFTNVFMYMCTSCIYTCTCMCTCYIYIRVHVKQGVWYSGLCIAFKRFAKYHADIVNKYGCSIRKQN